MLNLVKEDFVVFELAFEMLERLVLDAGEWVPTLILVNGTEKVVIEYGESGDPCITEAFDVDDRMKQLSTMIFGSKDKDE